MRTRRNGQLSSSSSSSSSAVASRRLVLSVAEAAEALGISDDLVYELTERGEIPCLHFGRRKVIPRQAIDLVVGLALRDFEAGVLLSRLAGRRRTKATAGDGEWTDQ